MEQSTLCKLASYATASPQIHPFDSLIYVDTNAACPIESIYMTKEWICNTTRLLSLY
jgi:hypothetical protein